MPARVGGLALIVLSLAVAACGSSEQTDPSGATPTSAPAAPADTDSPRPGRTGAIDIVIESNGGPAAGPIPLTVTVVNGTDETVTVVRPIVIPNFVSLRILDESGERMGFYGPQLQLAPLGEDGFAELAPGEETSHEFDLWEGYDLGPGVYRVTAEYLNPARGSHEGTRAVVFERGEGPVSAEITIEVTP